MNIERSASRLARVWLSGLLGLLVVACPLASSRLAADEAASLAIGLDPFLAVTSGEQSRFTLSAEVDVRIDGEPRRVEARLVRAGEQAFDLSMSYREDAVELRRRRGVTALALPKHRVVFVGRGETDGVDHLQPAGLAGRLVGDGTELSTYAPMWSGRDATTLIALMKGLFRMRYDRDAVGWRIGGSTTIRPDRDAGSLECRVGDDRVTLRLSDEAALGSAEDWPEYRTVEIPRDELERQLARGLSRTLEILLPSATLRVPDRTSRTVAHGALRWLDDHRVTLLWGTPEQIGRAHGELLPAETRRCVDSVLHAFGTVQTVINGRWFRHDLEEAYARLSPFIPEDHLRETRAVAEATGIDPRTMELVNVFPELFHCSGFALFGEATRDGKLYHGRVLDYMTTIGLHDAATTFVVAPEGKIAFANIGYAGFIGSVSGMNERAISLGEMGGAGEGQWDGVPMATLMRRALEECSTLDEVMALWRENPRTCEYYYVFADGKTNRAVGVAAVPESVEFVRPGQSHPLLGEGIPDAVVLSAGSRLQKLRERVLERHGEIDTEVAQWLMSRPVAMESNLHNVLFVPEDGLLYVAHADHRRPAAERPYVRLDLKALLASIPREMPTEGDAAADQGEAGPESGPAIGAVGDQSAAEAKSRMPHVGQRWLAKDSLESRPDRRADAEECLRDLRWEPAPFRVTIEPADGLASDWLVRFPSPLPGGDELNDRVAMEWYAAKGEDGVPAVAPAVIVVHESGRKMTVGRLFAWGLRQQGLHAFLVHLPHYGERRGDSGPDDSRAVTALRQAVADVRRARDAAVAIPAVDGRRVGLQGTSLGGFVAAVAGSLDAKFDEVFLMLAGGDLHDILANGEKDAARVRERLERSGVTGAALRTLTDQVEPTRVAHRLDPQTTWLYSGRFDRVVPLQNARRLADSIGLDDQHHVVLPFDHYTGIVYLPVMLDTITRRLTGRPGD